MRFPICTDRRSSLTTARSRGSTIGPPNATAAGGESSASVSDSWLSTPRYTGQDFDDASVETEGKSAYRWAARCVADAIARRTRPICSHSGHSRIFLSVDPAGASPASPPSVEAGRLFPQKRNFGGRLGRLIGYRATGIARKAPPVCKATTYLARKTTRPDPAVGQKEKEIATPSLVRSPASRRRCPRDTFPNLHRPSQIPHYRQKSRRGNRALKLNRGWRREFRISQRFMVIDAAVSRPELRRRLRRARRQGIVSQGGAMRCRRNRAENETQLLA